MAKKPETTPPDAVELLSHTGWVRTLAARLVLDPQHVDDVVQDVWQAALDKPPQPRTSLAAWLSGAVRNIALMGRRSEARRQRRENVAARPDAVPSTAELAERAELQSQLTHLVNQLPEVHRDVVLLRYFEDMPPRRIAQHLGIPVNTVRSRLSRALARLREELDAEHRDRRSWGFLLLPMIRPMDAVQAGVLTAQASLTAGAAEGARQFSLLKPALVGGVVVGTGIGVWLWFQDPGVSAPERVEYVHEEVKRQKPEVAREPILPKPVAKTVAPPKARFVGRTLDRFGEPVPDQLITMFRLAPDLMAHGTADYSPRQAAEPDFLVGRARTDGDGRFVIEGRWPESLFVATWGRQVRYITQTPTIGHPVDLGDLPVHRTTGITGRVVDTRGFPVAGARVRSANLPAGLLRDFPMWRLLDATRVIFARRGQVNDEVEGFWRRLLMLPQSPAKPTMLLRPRWLQSLAELMPFVATETDAEGRFRLEGLSRRGKTTLVVTSHGYHDLIKKNVAVDPKRIRKLEPLELTPASVARGEVLGSDGRPLVGAEVSVACVAGNGSPFHFALPTVRTGSYGRFEVKGITTPQIYLAVRQGPDDAWFIREVGATDFTTLRLPRRHRVDFRLLTRHRASIGTPEVTLLPGHQAMAHLRRGMAEPLVPGDRLITKQDGHFTIRNVLPGHYTLVVRCKGYGTQAIPLQVTRSFQHDLFLQPAARVKISVFDRNLKPVEGARVFARSVNPKGPLSEIKLACGSTDKEGNLTADTLVGDSIAITAMHPDHGSAHRLEALADGAEWRLRLDAPGRIHGQLLDRSRDIRSSRRWTVQMFPIPGTGALETAAAFSATDDSNRFARSALAEGSYGLRAIPDLAGIHPKEDLVRRLRFIDQVTPVIIVDSLAGPWVRLKTLEETVEADPTPVILTKSSAKGLSLLTGGVRLPDGRPAQGARLTLSRLDGGGGNHSRDSGEPRTRTARTDKMGQFQFRGLRKGEYLVEVRGRETGRSRSRVVITDDAPKPITVSLEPGVFVEGRLAKPGKLREIQFIPQDRHGNWLDEQGRVARVDLSKTGAHLNLPRVRLDASGRFEKALVLRPGRYQVTPAGTTVLKAMGYNVYVDVGDRDLQDIVLGPLLERPWLPRGSLPRPVLKTGKDEEEEKKKKKKKHRQKGRSQRTR